MRQLEIWLLYRRYNCSSFNKPGAQLLCQSYVLVTVEWKIREKDRTKFCITLESKFKFLKWNFFLNSQSYHINVKLSNTFVPK